MTLSAPPDDSEPSPRHVTAWPSVDAPRQAAAAAPLPSSAPSFTDASRQNPPADGSPGAAAPASSWLLELLAWWRSGWQGALLRAPRWPRLTARPGVLLALILGTTLLDLLVQRLYIDGPADFYLPALFSGWFSTLVAAGVCAWLVREPTRHAIGPPVPQDASSPAAVAALASDTALTAKCALTPSAGALFMQYTAQWFLIIAITSLVFVPAWRSGVAHEGSVWAWLGWWLPWLWGVAATAVLLRRATSAPTAARLAGTAAIALAILVGAWTDPLRPWHAARDDTEASVARFRWTPALIEAQMQTLPRALDALAPQRPGVVDVYAVTFAPSDDGVFLRESRMVTDVMQQRFDTAGRSLMLINHPDTAAEWPWASLQNLERTLARVAERMDRDEDVLFLHLTSHGAKSGQLATSFWPLEVAAITPAQLKAALNRAGIRYRVISVSACYAGSWIEPLADDHTLVMTAADAEHTSYGCGRASPLTFYGRAVFDEALRTQTRSFETALATARPIIDRREREAGKDDGYSNPQIRVGAQAREHLARLEKELAARPAGAAAAPGLAASTGAAAVPAAAASASASMPARDAASAGVTAHGDSAGAASTPHAIAR